MWFDETHPKCHIGGRTKGANQGYQLRFSRGPNGELQPDGTLQTKQTWLKVKYGKEIRLLLGCAMVKMSDGTFVGKRCKTFSYTGCWVHHIGVYNDEFIPKAIRTVKAKGSEKRWVTGTREKTGGDLYQGDCITRIKGISKAKQQKLAEVGIRKVADFNFTDKETYEKVLRINGIGKGSLQKFQQLSREAKAGCYQSQRVDHRKAANPYQSRYPETWKQEIALDIRKRQGVVCITELVEHMIEASQEVMNGTSHEHDWYFYHDALQQLADPRTKKWMQDKGYIRRWLLPIPPCNKGTTYEGVPVGNTPEVMPWDESLNQDTHECVEDHANYFKCISKDDPLYPK